MPAKPLPKIDHSEVKAVRQFLISLRDEDQQTRTAHPASEKGAVPLRHGITRARLRSGTRSSA